jgi:peptide/nickel transport system ATP-binding protein
MDAQEHFVFCQNLVKIYKIADLEVVALQGLDLAVDKGEILALIGSSGSGKSTLLNVIGGLDTPSAGGMWVNGIDLLKINDRDRVKYKRDVVGFVWQQPGRNLLSYLTARENVELPMMSAGRSGRERKERALELLEMVGLSDRVDFRPDRLSGGQQQRVALAIALANNPPLLLADEPTGQVDTESSNQIFAALRRINETFGTTIIIVTHDPRVAAKVDRVIGIRDGRTSTEIRRARNAHDGSLHEEEWVILDKAGRLQLPHGYVEALDLHGRVKVRLEDSHVSIWPSVVRALSETPAANGGEQNGNGSTHWRPRRDVFGLAAEPEREVEKKPKTAAVATRKLTRLYQLGVETIHAVQDVDLEIPAGAMVVVKGPSGSGKTTLLNLIAGLDEPTSGDVLIGGISLDQMSAGDKIELRRRQIGFVFQTFGLLPFLSARENVEVPLRLVRASRQERKQRGDDVLNLVGLSGRANHRTYELSGGEQQRVALARALVNRPGIILADEPTGQLDSLTGANIIALLRQIIEQTGVTVVIASHDPKVEEAADFVFQLRDGRLVTEEEASSDKVAA